MIKRQWYWNLREIRVFFYEWVERCETGEAWDLLCKKQKNVLWKVHSAVWHLFFVCLFDFRIFISSYQVKLGCLDLVWIDCRKFCALFFVCCVPFYSPSPFVRICFFPKIFGFFPKSLILAFACWDSLESFLPYFAIVFTFLFLIEVTAFCSKFSFIKGEPAQFRFHSSEFSVSIMHSSLLS